MIKTKFKSVHRRMTAEEKARHAKVREQVQRDQPKIERTVKAMQAEYVAIENALALLKQARIAKGLSLKDVADLSGITKSRLSKLENNPAENPTVQTLIRYTNAVGAELQISIKPAA